MTGVVEEGGLRVDAHADQVVLVGLHPRSVPTEELVDLVSVELQDVHVPHHQGADEDLVTGEDVRSGLLGEVVGVLQDLEETDCHQRTVESVLCPSEEVNVKVNPQREKKWR